MIKKQIAKLIIFPIILILITFLLSLILCHPGTYGELNYSLFYREQNLDVVFVGPSVVYNNFIPTQAYKNYGYTSYNYAGAGQTLDVTRYSISEVVRTQKPQLIVVELNSASYTTQVMEEVRLREFLDSIPNSSNKKKILKETKKDKDLSFKIKILNYHSNWRNPANIGGGAICNLYNIQNKKSVFKGWTTIERIFNPDAYTILPFTDEKTPITEENEQKLRNLLDYCASLEDQQFMFVRYPRWTVQDLNPDAQKQANYVRDIIAEYGYEYEDFSQDFISTQCDIYLDFSDHEHLNYFGATKFTNYLSQKILDKFEININHSEKEKEDWNFWAEECYNYAQKLKTGLETNPNERYYSEFNYYADKLGIKL